MGPDLTAGAGAAESLPGVRRGSLFCFFRVCDSTTFSEDTSMNFRIATLVIGALAMVVFAAGPGSATTLPAYNVTNLGSLPGTQSAWNYGFGLSPNGAYAVGGCIWTTTANDPGLYIPVGYLYNGTVQSLGPVPSGQDAGWGTGGPDAGGGSAGGINKNMPWAVNDSGTVAGQFNGTPFYSTGGAPVAIPGAPSGAAAYAIDDNGLIVGDWTNTGSSGFTYNLSTSQLTQIGMAAYGLSSNGVIAGSIDGWSEGAWRDAGGTIHDVSNFYSFTGVSSNGTYLAGVDASGKPAIYNTGTGQTTVVGPAGGTVQPNAWSVNDSGVAVGTMAPSYGTAGYFTDAFVSAGGTTTYIGNLTLVNAPSDVLQWAAATSIDDAGQILVQAQVPAAGQMQSFLLTPTLPGDANLDGKVDINDLTVVLTNYGKSTGMSWTTGDFIGDGTVDINDLTIVLAHYGTSLGSSAAGSMSAAPEPGTLALLAAAFAAVLAAGWRKRK
jgi:hypothetical protein